MVTDELVRRAVAGTLTDAEVREAETLQAVDSKDDKSVAEVTNELLLEVTQSHTNNTHRRILSKRSDNTGNTVVLDNPDLRGGFTQIPNVVLHDNALSTNAKLCYILLLSYAWQKGNCFPSQQALADDMLCASRTVIRTLKELTKRKLIKIERPGQGKPNVYHIKRLSDGYLPKQIHDRP